MTAVLAPDRPLAAPASEPGPAITPGGRRRTWTAWLPLGLTSLALLGAASTYSALFTGRAWWGPCAGAVLVSGGLMLASERLRAPWALRLLVLMVVFPLLAAPTLFWSATWTGVPSPASLADVIRAVSHGWRDLSTFGLPAEPSGALLTLPVAVLWLSAGSAVLVVRHRPGLRLAVLAPALAPVVFALVVAAPSGVPLGGLGVTIAASLLLALPAPTASWTDPAGTTDAPGVLGGAGDGGRRGEMARGMAVIALATAVGLVVAWIDPSFGRDRFSPGGDAEVPDDDVSLVSPLLEVKPLLEQPERLLFTIDGPAVDRVRLATLDEYDGALWTLEAPFRPVRGTLSDLERSADSGDDGSEADAEDATAGTVQATSRTRHRIDTGELPGPFLPTIGDPLRVDAEAVRFSPETETLIRAPGAAGRLTYVLDSLVGAPSEDELGAARRSTSTDLDRFRRLPAVPAPLVSLARDAVAGTDPEQPWTQLNALAAYLRTNYEYDERVAPGHSYAYLSRFLTDPEHGRGYAEQFATSFAVLARALGHPSRVVVGTDLGFGAAGPVRVTGAQIDVWAEVFLDGVGWTVFDPTPPRSDTDPPRASGQPLPPDDNTELGTAADLEIVPSPGGGGSGPSWVDRLPEPVALGPSLVAAVLTVGLLIVGAKRWRRHRRRTGLPARRVLGAWREAVDRLVESGVAVRRSQSASEVAAAGADRLGSQLGGLLAQLVPAVDTAIYDVDGPDEETAAGSWSTLVAFERRLRSRRRLARRLLAPLDPRPLLRTLR